MGMKIIAILLYLCCLAPLQAKMTVSRQGRDIFIHLPKVQVQRSLSRSGLSKISIPGLVNSTLSRGPSLPQVSFILEGKPKSLKVELSILNEEVLDNVRPFPGQLTQSRVDRFQVSEEMSEELYSKGVTEGVELHYIGEFRGPTSLGSK